MTSDLSAATAAAAQRLCELFGVRRERRRRRRRWLRARPPPQPAGGTSIAGVEVLDRRRRPPRDGYHDGGGGEGGVDNGGGGDGGGADGGRLGGFLRVGGGGAGGWSRRAAPFAHRLLRRRQLQPPPTRDCSRGSPCPPSSPSSSPIFPMLTLSQKLSEVDALNRRHVRRAQLRPMVCWVSRVVFAAPAATARPRSRARTDVRDRARCAACSRMISTNEKNPKTRASQSSVLARHAEGWSFGNLLHSRLVEHAPSPRVQPHLAAVDAGAEARPQPRAGGGRCRALAGPPISTRADCARPTRCTCSGSLVAAPRR